MPVRIWEGSGKGNTLLELLYYQGEWQLATDDALYSDGSKYRPLKLAFRHIRRRLYTVEKMLVLGAGLGSALHVLHKMGVHPTTTLVDHDEEILRMAAGTLSSLSEDVDVDFVTGDAEAYIHNTTQQWNLIVIDVFTGRIVPPFVTTEDFMQQCRRCLTPGGTVVINYMVLSQADWKSFKQIVDSLYAKVDVLDHGINRILIATV